MKKVTKQKTHEMLNRHASGWNDGWAWDIVNTAIIEANGDYEQLQSDLAGTSNILKRVCIAIATRRDEIEL